MVSFKIFSESSRIISPELKITTDRQDNTIWWVVYKNKTIGKISKVRGTTSYIITMKGQSPTHKMSSNEVIPYIKLSINH
jgi:hypothetical protein